MSMINKEVNDFSVQAYQNGEFKTVTKTDIIGKWSVFFFYPADFTLYALPNLKIFRTNIPIFRLLAVKSILYLQILISYTKHGMIPLTEIGKITYPMLADPTHTLCKDFEVLIESDGMAERGSFIVNPEGKIVVYEVNAGNVGRNADELFRRLQASQFVAEHGDQVCPAKWQPGEETLKPSLDLVGML